MKEGSTVSFKGAGPPFGRGGIYRLQGLPELYTTPKQWPKPFRNGETDVEGLSRGVVPHAPEDSTGIDRRQQS
jgi:hypothetical protein